jgi:hypothetical protein
VEDPAAGSQISRESVNRRSYEYEGYTFLYQRELGAQLGDDGVLALALVLTATGASGHLPGSARSKPRREFSSVEPLSGARVLPLAVGAA